MKGSLTIVGFFVAGVLVGRFGVMPPTYASATSTVVLYALLVLVGLSVGADAQSWSALRTTDIRIVLVPVCAISGSLLGSVGVWMTMNGWQLNDVIAVGFGMGYYSLSSILIDQIRGGELAVVALLANILREITTLLAAIPLRRLFGPLAPIASGGATSMDTTLPIIVNASGKEYAIVAVVNGSILTLLAPILVTLALGASP